MPKTLTMIDPRPNGSGGQYERGQTYTLADDLADYFLSIGVARYPTLQQTQVLADRDPATGEVSTIGTGRDPLGTPVVAVTSPGGVVRKSNGLAVGELGVGSVIYAQCQHDGYLPANGAVYSIAAYRALRATIGTVPDGAATWTVRASAADNNWYSVCWSPELSIFCAVATSGTGNRVMTSPDGITWTVRASAADNNWYSVCWSPELSIFCAVAASGTGNRVMTNAPALTYNPKTHFKLPSLPNATSGEARAFIYAGA